MKKVPLLLLISMLFLCMKCEDYLAPEGMESSVYGRVYDSINDIPVTGLKIKIAEIAHNIASFAIPDQGTSPADLRALGQEMALLAFASASCGP